jgi:hypothetical protein
MLERFSQHSYLLHDFFSIVHQQRLALCGIFLPEHAMSYRKNPWEKSMKEPLSCPFQS